ncbi:hypothetical protein [Streptomyces sp. F001]|uniref:hypothetical protein n=1 Tax=Streptomyces sp. F001 TaxID=1510026 RepID=UPI001F0FD873|nr:hypothetical protein [Streptomyces sp. F001]
MRSYQSPPRSIPLVAEAYLLVLTTPAGWGSSACRTSSVRVRSTAWPTAVAGAVSGPCPAMMSLRSPPNAIDRAPTPLCPASGRTTQKRSWPDSGSDRRPAVRGAVQPLLLTVHRLRLGPVLPER